MGTKKLKVFGKGQGQGARPLTVKEQLQPKPGVTPKKILFLNPPSDATLMSWNLYAPTGILSLLAVARQAGHQPSWLDAGLEKLSDQQVLDHVRQLKPDYVGFTVLSSYAYDCYRMAELIKEMDPGIKILFGNQHATGLDFGIMKRIKAVDCIVRNEGELTLVDILDNGITPETPGITLRDEHGVPFRTRERERIENLDDLPLPAYDLVNFEGYVSALEAARQVTQPSLFQKKTRCVSIIASRGCFAKCTFCATPGYWGLTKMFSPQRLCDVIEKLINEFHVDDYFFFDDIFPPSKKWMRDFHAEVMKRGLKFNYACETRVDQILPDTVKWMKETGCYMIYHGLETGSPEINESIQKGVKTEQVADKLKIAVDAGLKVGAFFITGFPGETEEDLLNTVEFASTLPLSHYYFAVAHLMPNSQMLAENPIPEDAWFEGYDKTRSGNSPLPQYRRHYPLKHDLTLEDVIRYANFKSGFAHLWRTVQLYMMIRPPLRAITSVAKVHAAETIQYGGDYPFRRSRDLPGRAVDTAAAALRRIAPSRHRVSRPSF